MKELITPKQGIALILAFILDGAIIFPTAADAGRNLWISIIIAIAMSLLLFTLYYGIQMLYPGKNFYEINELTLGKIGGSIVNVFYIWYFLHLGALTVRDFGEFISVLSMPETPKIVIMAISTLVGVYIVKKGIEVIGRFSLFASVFSSIIIILLSLLLIPKIDINNILPIMGEGTGPVLKGAWDAFTFPFAECVLFIVVLSNLNNHKATRKTYYAGLALGGGFLLLASFFEIATLGEEMYRSLYFTSYTALSRIKFGEFIQRLEIVGGLVFNVFGIIKIVLCLYVASVGISRIFNIKDYRTMVLPMGLLMLNLSSLLYDNVMDLVAWTTKVYRYYAIPFQIFFPVLIFIAGRVRKINGKAK